MKEKLIKNSDKKLKINIYNSGKNSKNPVIFLPGYNMRPRDYKNFFKKINKKIYAIDYLSSKPKITSIKDYSDLVYLIIKELKLKDFYLIGHSLGGGISFSVSNKVSPKKVIAINPLLEVDYELREFKKRFFRVAKNKFLRRFGLYINFLSRYIRNFFSLRKLYFSLSDFKIPSNLRSPFLVLLAEKDEFFEDKHIPLKKFEKLEIIKTPGRHFNLVCFQEEIFNRINDFIKD